MISHLVMDKVSDESDSVSQSTAMQKNRILLNFGRFSLRVFF